MRPPLDGSLPFSKKSSPLSATFRNPVSHLTSRASASSSQFGTRIGFITELNQTKYQFCTSGTSHVSRLKRASCNLSGSSFILRPYAPADEDAAIELWRRTWQQ